MIDWRTFLKPERHPQNPQNTQNLSPPVNFEDIEEIEYGKPDTVQAELAADQIEIEPACKPDGSAQSPVYWEDVRGRIVGPGVLEFSARIGGEYWLVVQYQGLPSWIHTDRLRSKRQWETAVTPQDLTSLLMTSSPLSIAQRPSPPKAATNPQLFSTK